MDLSWFSTLADNFSKFLESLSVVTRLFITLGFVMVLAAALAKRNWESEAALLWCLGGVFALGGFAHTHTLGPVCFVVLVAGLIEFLAIYILGVISKAAPSHIEWRVPDNLSWLAYVFLLLGTVFTLFTIFPGL